jgi:hypothetical protein
MLVEMKCPCCDEKMFVDVSTSMRIKLQINESVNNLHSKSVILEHIVEDIELKLDTMEIKVKKIIPAALEANL